MALTPRPRGAVRRLPDTGFDVLAELSLVLFSFSVILGFLRLFEDSSFVVPLAASTLTAHVVVAGVRWARGGIIISTLVSAIGLVVTAAVLYPPSTVVDGGFLSTDVLRGFATDAELAYDAFQTASAPSEVTAPYLLMIAVVMWVVAYLSDWAAFRLRSAVEALIPGAAIYVFGSLFSAEQWRVLTAILFIASALFFVLTHRLGEVASSGAWLGRGAVTRGQQAMLRGGAVLVAVTLLTGVAGAQMLPNYGEEPDQDITSWNDPEAPRVVVSPLVDIRSRLVDQPDVEVFTVRSDQSDYWRITSLDVFDGRIWRSRGSFESASGELDTNLPGGTAFDAVIQEFDINRLGGIWMPAAYEPAEVLSKPDDVGLEYEAESGTLIVNRDRDDSDGLVYRINSAVPRRDLAAISNAGNSVPAEIRDRYLELPSDFSERVVNQAEEIVSAAGAQTPYQKARALQDFFRDPTLFRYSLEIGSGHSSERLEDFLFETRIGYCEQFAGSYAAMARAIDLPARVAVGFTTGVRDPNDNLFRVNGRHAHAWPEVWIEGIGWLRFEPTPGRGAPRDELYTGQPEMQASDLPGNPATTAPVNPTDSVRGGPQDQTGEARAPETTTTIAPQGDRAESGIIGGDSGISPRVIFGWLIGITIVVFLLAVPLLVGILRDRARSRAVAVDPRRRLGLTWNRATNAIRLRGVAVPPSATPTEVVDRLRQTDERSADLFEPLAEQITRSTYSTTSLTLDEAKEFDRIVASLAASAKAEMGTVNWWAHHANPKHVFGTQSGVWEHVRS